MKAVERGEPHALRKLQEIQNVEDEVQALDAEVRCTDQSFFFCGLGVACDAVMVLNRSVSLFFFFVGPTYELPT